MPQTHHIVSNTSPEKTGIHIIGAGSIGLLWAAYLSKKNKAVTLISRQISTQPQTLSLTKSTDATAQQYNVESENSESDTTIHTLLVCTKAFDAFAAIHSCSHRLAKHCDIVLLQNGMGYQSALLEAFSDFNFYVGITTEGALKQGPLEVIHTGLGSTNLGCIHHHSNNKALAAAALAHTLDNDLIIQVQNNIELFQWQKLIINCVINPLTVYFNCLNGQLRDNSDAQLMKQALICECRLLLQQLGKTQYLDNIEHTLDAVMQKTAANSSSMREDFLHQKKTEIEYINGYILALAKQHAIYCPTHEFLVEYIQTQGTH